MNKAKRDLSKTTKRVVRKGKKALHTLESKGKVVTQDALSDLEREAQVAKKKSEEWVKKNPLRAVGSALAAGVIAGMMLKKKKKK